MRYTKNGKEYLTSTVYSKYMLRDWAKPLEYYSKRPTQKEILGLFKHRKKGSIYYELWKYIGLTDKKYNPRIKVQTQDYLYTLVDRKEIPVKLLW